MKTLTIRLPREIYDDLSDSGKLNPDDMRSLIDNCLTTYINNDCLLKGYDYEHRGYSFINYQFKVTDKVHYTLKLEGLKKGLTLLNFGGLLFSNYYTNMEGLLDGEYN